MSKKFKLWVPRRLVIGDRNMRKIDHTHKNLFSDHQVISTLDQKVRWSLDIDEIKELFILNVEIVFDNRDDVLDLYKEVDDRVDFLQTRRGMLRANADDLDDFTDLKRHLEEKYSKRLSRLLQEPIVGKAKKFIDLPVDQNDKVNSVQSKLAQISDSELRNGPGSTRQVNPQQVNTHQVSNRQTFRRTTVRKKFIGD